jgi:hypothetical protein
MSFSRFTDLPLELQDLIWEACLVSPPVHLVIAQRYVPPDNRPYYCVNLFRTPQYRHLSLYLDPSYVTRPYISELDTLRAILCTSRRSHAVAKRYLASLTRPPLPKAASLQQAPTKRSNDYREQRPVDAISDILAFQLGWHDTYRFATRGARRDQVRYLALTCVPSDPDWAKDAFDFVQGTLFYSFRGLAVVYILVDPRELVDFYMLWPVNWQLTTWEYGTVFLEGYLAAYTEGGASTSLFAVHPGNSMRSRRRSSRS